MVASGLFRALSAALTAAGAPPGGGTLTATQARDAAAAPPEQATRANVHVARGVCCGVLAVLRACMLEADLETAKAADAAVSRPFLNAATEALARLWTRHGGCAEVQRYALELAARLAAAPVAHVALTATLPVSEACAVAATGTLRTRSRRCVPAELPAQLTANAVHCAGATRDAHLRHAVVAYLSTVLERCTAMADRAQHQAALLPPATTAAAVVGMLARELASPSDGDASHAAHVLLHLLRCAAHANAARAALVPHIAAVAALLQRGDPACLRHGTGVLWLLACDDAGMHAVADAGVTAQLAALLSSKARASAAHVAVMRT